MLTICRQQEFSLDLRDGNNEDLIKKNKKRKPLGFVQVSLLRAIVLKARSFNKCKQMFVFVKLSSFLLVSPLKVFNE